MNRYAGLSWTAKKGTRFVIEPMPFVCRGFYEAQASDAAAIFRPSRFCDTNGSDIAAPTSGGLIPGFAYEGSKGES